MQHQFLLHGCEGNVNQALESTSNSQKINHVTWCRKAAQNKEKMETSTTCPTENNFSGAPFSIF